MFNTSTIGQTQHNAKSIVIPSILYKFFITFPLSDHARTLSKRERWPTRPTVTENVPALNPVKMTAQRADTLGALNRQSLMQLYRKFIVTDPKVYAAQCNAVFIF